MEIQIVVSEEPLKLKDKQYDHQNTTGSENAKGQRKSKESKVSKGSNVLKDITQIAQNHSQERIKNRPSNFDYQPNISKVMSENSFKGFELKKRASDDS